MLDAISRLTITDTLWPSSCLL